MNLAVGAAVSIANGTLGLHRLEAAILLNNTALQRLLEKNGFKPYGIARGYLKIAGKQDHRMFQQIL